MRGRHEEQQRGQELDITSAEEAEREGNDTDGKYGPGDEQTRGEFGQGGDSSRNRANAASVNRSGIRM